MSYATGSGDYLALMTAIVNFAVADGWTEANGVGTGWPLTKNGVFYDYATGTGNITDVTLGGVGGVREQRFIRLGHGLTAVDATAHTLVGHNTYGYSFAYPISSWYLFSDPAVSDHIHVVTIASNGVDINCCTHMSFGSLAKEGLTYDRISYVAAGGAAIWATTAGSGINGSGTWNSIHRTFIPYAGSVGEGDDCASGLSTLIIPTNHPIPSPGPAVGGWPAAGVPINNGGNILTMNRPSVDDIGPNYSSNTAALNWLPAAASVPMPFSGSISMTPMPIFLMNGAATTSQAVYVGAIPNVRLCSIAGFNVGDEVTFGSDTWVVFAHLNKTDNSLLGSANRVTSGEVGYAYKKVV